MKYVSTRGLERELTAEEVLFTGYAPDGGLLLPSSFPSFSPSLLSSLRDYSYSQLCLYLLSHFVSEEEVPREDLKKMVGKSFSSFSLKETVGLKKLDGNVREGTELWLLELFHGPTGAFKDLALSMIGQLLDYFLEKRKTTNQKHIHTYIVVGTSGDTGSAAMQAVKGSNNMDIIVLYPVGRVSPIQEAQMTSIIAKNVHLFAAEGNSDEIDQPIKELFFDHDLCKENGVDVISINSINWFRILMQIVHHFYAYLRIVLPQETLDEIRNDHKDQQMKRYEEACNQEVTIVIPSGACGHATSALIAKKMGLNIKVVAAVNSNDIVHHFLSTGVYSPSSSSHQSIPTLSPSMDILCPYNVERILSLVLPTTVSEWVKSESENPFCLSHQFREAVNKHISSFCVSDEQILYTIKRCFEEENYVIDPHTAVGLFAAYEIMQKECSMENRKKICVYCTADAYKFPEVVAKALEKDIQFPKARDLLQQTKSDKIQTLQKTEDWRLRLKNFILQLNKANGL